MVEYYLEKERVESLADDLYGMVATLNADPFCVEDEEQVEGLMSYYQDDTVFVLCVPEGEDDEEWEIFCDRLDCEKDDISEIIALEELCGSYIWYARENY